MEEVQDVMVLRGDQDISNEVRVSWPPVFPLVPLVPLRGGALPSIVPWSEVE